MTSSNHAVYLIAEIDRDDIVKIGTCQNGGQERFKEGAYVNPRGLRFIASWRMANKMDAAFAERAAHTLFTPYAPADGKEWFEASPEKAIVGITTTLGRPPDLGPENPPSWALNFYDGKVYDEFRDLGAKEGFYKGRLVQRRIWVHEEEGTEFKKISCNTWWCEPKSRSSNDKRTTFNTCRLRYVACLAIPVPEEAMDWEERVRIANLRTVEVYQQAVGRFGLTDKPTGRAGWTLAELPEILMFLSDRGFSPIPTDPLKPPRGVKSLTYRNR